MLSTFFKLNKHFENEQKMDTSHKFRVQEVVVVLIYSTILCGSPLFFLIWNAGLLILAS
jgi:hypothetical protein